MSGGTREDVEAYHYHAPYIVNKETKVIHCVRIVEYVQIHSPVHL